MSWLKDNLILLLAVALAGVVIYAVVSYNIAAASYARLETAHTVTKSSLKSCRDANTSAQAAIDELAAANQSIVTQHQADLAAAGVAARRVQELAESLSARTAENNALRRRLAKENPDVAAHLAVPVPCALARQLWPEAGYCQD